MFITFCKTKGEKSTIYIPWPLALTLTFNHLANELLQPTTMLFSLKYLTCGSVTEHKCLIRCTTDYKWLLKLVTGNSFKPGELRLYPAE